jgi:hypothetical protein
MRAVAFGLLVLACWSTVAFAQDIPGSDDVMGMATFSTAAQEHAARQAMEGAERTYKAAESTEADFVGSSRSSCDDRAMLRAVGALQSIEIASHRYVEVATSAPLAADREAALDVVETLDGYAIDGYMHAAAAFEARGCQGRAASIYRAFISVYTGPSYVKARAFAEERLRALAMKR